MIDELLLGYRERELNLAATKIAHRREYARLRRIEHLEEQLAVARARAGTVIMAGAS